MADGLREVLSKYVPEHVLEAVVEEVQEAATPDTFRKQLAELGGKAKKADELEAELNSIRSAPKRKEALKRLGIDYDAQPRYGQKTLDAIPADKLDDLEFVANFVKEEGFEAQLSPDQNQSQEGRPPAAQIVDHATAQGSGMPPVAQGDEEFYRELDQIPDGDKTATRELLRKYGKLQATEGIQVTQG